MKQDATKCLVVLSSTFLNERCFCWEDIIEPFSNKQYMTDSLVSSYMKMRLMGSIKLIEYITRSSLVLIRLKGFHFVILYVDTLYVFLPHMQKSCP